MAKQRSNNIKDIHGENLDSTISEGFSTQGVKPKLVKLKLSEIVEGVPLLVEIWPKDEYMPIIVLRHEQKIFCYINRCPHAGWPLETVEGKFLFSMDGDLICAGHGASFDIIDGRCMGGPGRGLPLKAYEFKILNDYVIIGED